MTTIYDVPAETLINSVAQKLKNDQKVKPPEWAKFAKATNVPMRPDRHCLDCTPEFKLKMLDEGRCERPETVFGIDNEGGVFGCSPKKLNRMLSLRIVAAGRQKKADAA